MLTRKSNLMHFDGRLASLAMAETEEDTSKLSTHS